MAEPEEYTLLRGELAIRTDELREARAEVESLEKRLKSTTQGLEEFSELHGRAFGHLKRLVAAISDQWDWQQGMRQQVDAAIAKVQSDATD